MRISFALVTLLVLTLVTSVFPQEIVITDFPLGVGGSIGREFFKPYDAQLRSLSDTLAAYPRGLMIITGTADGVAFHSQHDAKNPGLALGRAHVVRNLLISQYGVDSARIAIQSVDFKSKGGQYRSVIIRVERELFEPAIAEIPTPEPHQMTAIPEHTHPVAPMILRQMGIQFGVGWTSSPFGGIPFGAAALTWNRIVYLEASLGYTFWNNEYKLDQTTLDTRRRTAGARLIVYPFESIPVGAVAGWSRSEDLSQDYYQYVQLSEGLEFGLRATPFEYLSVTGVYNPSMRREVGLNHASAKNNQFQISLMLHKLFGGDR